MNSGSWIDRSWIQPGERRTRAARWRPESIEIEQGYARCQRQRKPLSGLHLARDTGSEAGVHLLLGRIGHLRGWRGDPESL